ncbi:MAG: DUF1775 domain-containing protein [Phenylobacterium sp.]|uniref:DUF1775 domain-containing protein n=1 Tax=Phenylobacterium sp. TaxID=1871053 RepID=UPI0027272D08|nr:DUF1775 domain-containing protein [Phenylobacterium sp.]MDO8914426.1 DUF1775 domain-containing protein [Phenylobacterium sp.]MDP3100719.1 DUF1775 domain-containing protein [Phenylobacterium sp.]MDP3635700.1 DUF1775 domain-containing protein [Phenylobacterium sp.]
MLHAPRCAACCKPPPPPPRLPWLSRTNKPPSTARSSWRPADQFDAFAVLTKLPPEPGAPYFPAVQTCGAEESQWAGIPDPGETSLCHPAPALRVLPAETHQH